MFSTFTNNFILSMLLLACAGKSLGELAKEFNGKENNHSVVDVFIVCIWIMMIFGCISGAYNF